LSQGFSPLGRPNKPLVSYSIKPSIIEVESSSTGNTRLRGALGKGALLRAVPTASRVKEVVVAALHRVRGNASALDRAFAHPTHQWLLP
jgi:hypothetical protein